MKIKLCVIFLLHFYLFNNYTIAEQSDCQNYKNYDERGVEASVKLDFYFKKNELNTKITTINCSKQTYYFHPGDLGKDIDDSYMYILVTKLDMFNFKKVNELWMKFNGPVKTTPYMTELASGKMKRIALKPNEVAVGNFNLSKRYDIKSGFYFVSFYTTDWDTKVEQKSLIESPDDILWALSSKTYLVDIDVENSKVLYGKEIISLE